MKQYYIQTNIGKAKYVVNHHDGISTHEDGSIFFDVTIFTNKKQLNKFITRLRKLGYKEIK